MKPNITRVMLALASLGLSDAELRRLLFEMRQKSVDDIVHRVSVLSDVSSAGALDHRRPVVMPDGHRSSQRDATVGERVEWLLKHEAGLSSAAAREVLANMLIETGALSRDEIPTISKKALRIWVDKIVQRVPAKEVLRVATIARNAHVHSPQRDWSLETRSE